MLFFQEFHKANVGFLWNEAETHTIVNNELLAVASEDVTISNLDTLGSDCPVLIVFGLVGPEDIRFLSTLFGELGKIITTKDHLSWNSLLVRKVDTEHGLEIFIKVRIILKLGDKAWDTIMEWVVNVLLIGWGRSKTNKSRSFQSTKISGLHDSQERDVVDAVIFALGEAESICRGVTHDSASSVLNDLTSFLVIMELRRFVLLILFVWSRTIVILTFFRVNPCSWRSSIENDLHFLSWVTEVKFTFISHVFEIFKVTSCGLFWFTLLVQVMESDVAALLQRNIQSRVQVHIKFVGEGLVCGSLGKLILVWFLGNVDLNQSLLRVLFLDNVDLFNINGTDAGGEKQKRES